MVQNDNSAKKVREKVLYSGLQTLFVSFRHILVALVASK